MPNVNRVFNHTFVSAVVSTLLLMQSAYAEPMSTPVPLVEDNTGFKSIFDGKTLKGWDGDSRYWRVDDGAIVGETTTKNTTEIGRQSDSFIIWRGGRTADFELKLEYQISAGGNSGVAYRSREAPDDKYKNMDGYQWDIDGNDDFMLKLFKLLYEHHLQPKGLDTRRVLDLKRLTGQVWEQGGRGCLSLPGQFSHVSAEGKREVATLFDGDTATKTISEGWNKLHLIARGNQVTHILNGRVISMLIDDDVANRPMDGLLALQLHADALMKVEFRNIRFKVLQD